jgi:hypothetical protein
MLQYLSHKIELLVPPYHYKYKNYATLLHIILKVLVVAILNT